MVEFPPRVHELQQRIAARLLRLADGPDEVHRNPIGRMELDRYRQRAA